MQSPGVVVLFLDRHQGRAVIILGYTNLFLDSDVAEEERLAVLGTATKKLHSLVIEHPLPVQVMLSENAYSELVRGWLDGADRTVVSTSRGKRI